VRAQASFATRPVRVVVPFAAGGATDVITRVLGERMGQRFGQSVVDNKPGAAGLIVGEAVVKAMADGMTVLLCTTSSILTNKYIYKKTAYDPLTDLTPLVRVCLAPTALVVTTDAPVKTFQEFMAWIQAHKDKLSYGSYGIGSHGQLVCTSLSEVAGADMSHVAYRGEAPMMQDLLGGQVKIGMGSLLSLKPHIDAGKPRALAVTSPRRVPCAAAARGAHLHRGRLPAGCAVNRGLAGDCRPQGQPADVARQWADAANRAVASRAGLARIIAAGFVPVDDDTPEKIFQTVGAGSPGLGPPAAGGGRAAHLTLTRPPWPTPQRARAGVPSA
jgi:tripartite-type tricarboxylate transporter receptor subunit TctC